MRPPRQGPSREHRCCGGRADDLGCASLPATAPPVGRVSRVGVLMPASAAVASPALQAFQQVLRERGYRESHTLVLEYRFAEGRYERLPSLAAELVRLPVDVLVAGSPSMIRAATQHRRPPPFPSSASECPQGSLPASRGRARI